MGMMSDIPSYESASARFAAEVLNGERNPFVTLEAQGENIQMLWSILAKQGAEVWEKNSAGASKRPEGNPGSLMYYVRAVDMYNREMFNYFAAILPDLYAFSESDVETLDPAERERLRELIRRHEAEWVEFMSSLKS
jgi:hypothetical protein